MAPKARPSPSPLKFRIEVEVEVAYRAGEQVPVEAVEDALQGEAELRLADGLLGGGYEVRQGGKVLAEYEITAIMSVLVQVADEDE